MFVAETAVLMIKESLLVPVRKKITNTTLDLSLVSETVRVTTVVASTQSALITNASLVKKTNTSTLLRRNASLIHAHVQVAYAQP